MRSFEQAERTFFMEEKISEKIKELLAENNFSSAVSILCDNSTIDIADFLLSIDENTAMRMFKALPDDISADVFACLGTEMQGKMSSKMTESEKAEITESLENPDEELTDAKTGDEENDDDDFDESGRRIALYEHMNELLDNGKFAQLRKELIDLNEVDIAEFILTLDDEESVVVFRILPKDISADVFAYLDSDIQSKIATAMTDTELYRLINELYIDDTVDFLEEVPANVVSRVLSVTSKEKRNTINRFLNYPEDSAGSIMTNELVTLHTQLTVDAAIASIRKTGVHKETVYQCYCIDRSRHLVGTVGLNDLLFNDSDKLIGDIMDSEKQLIYVETTDDREKVAEIAKRYDLLSVPVVDSEMRLVGIVTIDDIVDIIEDKNTEDFERMALLVPSDDTYLKTGVLKLTKNRILWLLILMVSATFTGKIIENFESRLALIAGLTACIPMLMDTGGNAGNQSSTLIIRGLALGEIRIRDYYRVVFKEFRVSLICGVILAVVNFGRMCLIGVIDGSFATDRLMIYLVVSISVIFAVVIAKIIGCSLPILAKLCKLDPALMAGPMITTIVDAITLLIYFRIANLMLF